MMANSIHCASTSSKPGPFADKGGATFMLAEIYKHVQKTTDDVPEFDENSKVSLDPRSEFCKLVLCPWRGTLGVPRGRERQDHLNQDDRVAFEYWHCTLCRQRLWRTLRHSINVQGASTKPTPCNAILCDDPSILPTPDKSSVLLPDQQCLASRGQPFERHGDKKTHPVFHRPYYISTLAHT